MRPKTGASGKGKTKASPGHFRVPGDLMRRMRREAAALNLDVSEYMALIVHGSEMIRRSLIPEGLENSDLLRKVLGTPILLDMVKSTAHAVIKDAVKEYLPDWRSKDVTPEQLIEWLRGIGAKKSRPETRAAHGPGPGGPGVGGPIPGQMPWGVPGPGYWPPAPGSWPPGPGIPPGPGSPPGSPRFSPPGVSAEPPGLPQSSPAPSTGRSDRPSSGRTASGPGSGSGQNPPSFPSPGNRAGPSEAPAPLRPAAPEFGPHGPAMGSWPGVESWPGPGWTGYGYPPVPATPPRERRPLPGPAQGNAGPRAAGQQPKPGAKPHTASVQRSIYDLPWPPPDLLR
ncbi:hypothetical protein Btus_2550 [Kyrpidia tusciae DSM 2912]|uniref:Uncharacterized protein n=1 Tax=Kyrpidia tusciae (strain DSM 2912 / NBRC 15312 / T2) TaxID=562970 RepID=D5WTH2_KYRT2|nr:hypothetical protein Btus_2550 [Kyrpidia tusciae DSM 2912]